MTTQSPVTAAGGGLGRAGALTPTQYNGRGLAACPTSPPLTPLAAKKTSRHVCRRAHGQETTHTAARPQHVEKYLKERMAIQRFGRTEEISDVVVFLCGEKASFCVGSAFLVDGGQGRVFFAQEG